jgi:hypothetical protein
MPQIATVSFDLITQAVQAANNNRQAGPSVAVIAALSKKYSSDDILAVMYRLHALANMTAKQQTENWTMEVAGKEYTLVNAALFKAAARIPLSIDANQMMEDVSFDPEALLAVALEESKPDGAA